MWGVYFDTAWHRTVGRDTFFSLPHLFIYGAGFLVWVSCVTAVVLATRERLADLGGIVLHAGPLRLPLGFALCGLGTATIVLAIPTDLAWHAIFGKDLLIWSPPHLQGVVGGAIGALGILFAVAGQKGRGALAPRWRWQLVMLLPLVDLLHYVHWSLAHYTLFPWTRTPDFYPFIVALTVPLIVVAAARAAGAWTPTWAGLLFVVAIALIDGLLAAIDFARPTITPLFFVPAIPVSLLYAWWPERRHAASTAIIAGVVYLVGFVLMEAAWMAWVLHAPWETARVLAGVPVALVTSAASGWMGWVLGGYLVASSESGGVAAVFGNARRGRWAAYAAVALMVVGLVSTYRPQVYGPPLSPAEMRLDATRGFPPHEAIFLDAVNHDDWPAGPALAIYSEGTMDGIPLPIGPAWCAADDTQLDAELPFLRFSLRVNGTALDLSPYPLIRQRVRDGRACAWVGVVSRGQRASQNRFEYAIDVADGAPAALRPLRVEATVVFKDP
jgi:hypothetical protein